MTVIDTSRNAGLLTFEAIELAHALADDLVDAGDAVGAGDVLTRAALAGVPDLSERLLSLACAAIEAAEANAGPASRARLARLVGMVRSAEEDVLRANRRPAPLYGSAVAEELLRGIGPVGVCGSARGVAR